MTIHAKKTSLIRAILMVFTAFLLTSCRLEGTIDYRPDAKTVLSFEVEDSTGSMTKIKQTCESVKIMAQANASFIKNPKVEDLTSPGGNTKCKVTSNEPLGGAPGLREDSKSYRVEVPASRKKTDYSGFIVKMTIIMPGRVTKANIGKIDGNKVMIDDPTFRLRRKRRGRQRLRRQMAARPDRRMRKLERNRRGATAQAVSLYGDGGLLAAAFWRLLQEPGSFSDAGNGQLMLQPPVPARHPSFPRLWHNRHGPTPPVSRPQTHPPIRTTTPRPRPRQATATTRPRPLLKHRAPTTHKTTPTQDTAPGKTRINKPSQIDDRGRRFSDFTQPKRRRPAHAKLRSVRLCKPSDSQNKGDLT